MSVVAPHKRYLVDKKPFLKHFHPKDVSLTAVRVLTVQGLLVFNNFIASLELDESSDEEDDEDSSSEDEDDGKTRRHRHKHAHRSSKKKPDTKSTKDWEPPSSHEFCMDCSIALVKSLSITTCVRSMESLTLRWCRSQLVDKLVKDVSKSATRKYARFSSRYAAAIRVAKTGMRSNVLSHVAIFIVEEAQQVIVILYKWYVARKQAARLANGSSKKRLRSVSSSSPSEPSEAVQFLQITMQNAARSCLGIVTGGVGAAIGTMVRPGVGTFVGATLGDTIAYAF